MILIKLQILLSHEFHKNQKLLEFIIKNKCKVDLNCISLFINKKKKK